MKRLLSVLAALTVLLAFSATFAAAATSSAAKATTPTAAAPTRDTDSFSEEDDADVPGFLRMDKEAYLRARGDAFMRKYDGATPDEIMNGKLQGLAQMQAQKGLQGFASPSFWTPIGPYPIPNGQTTTVQTAVSGRVTAIAVHPTDANTVYVGTANGGVWKTTNGGTTWTPIFENAVSLAIGALALAPSNPSILYVGTGEANFSGDCYFGVGVYRIDNVDTSPTLAGPFNPIPTTDVIGARCFSGRAISKIVVSATDPATIFVGNTQGLGGLYGEALGASPPITGLRGVYRSTNATSASPSFSKLTVSSASSIAPDVSGNQQITDIVLDPTDATGNTMLVWVLPAAAATGGVFRSTNVLDPTPTNVTYTQQFSPGVVSIRGTFALTQAGGPLTIYVATGEAATGTSCTTGSGVIRKSVDGGLTWSAKLSGGGGFCGGQCVYDQPIAVSPANANIVLIGGAGNGTCSRVYTRSTDGALTFAAAGVADVGMHADAHAIVFAPSNANIVYEGNDGGIWKSVDAGASFVSINNAGFSATQFQSIDVHPIDPNFSIGGTQDNGTNMYQPLATWNRIDFGDGGFAVIDQNAANNAAVTMYHTYFNQRNNLVAYGRVTSVAAAFDGNWTLLGQNLNGISVAENPNFYAPLVRGPGSPNTIYYATDRLHRSTDTGTTNPVVSQAPIALSGGLGVPISAVAIAPSNDNVRLVGLNNFQIWGTATGSSVLTNMTGGGMPAHTIGRIAIDPTNANVAYVCYGGFGVPAGQHVWKTTNLLSGTPTWAASGSGLPDVPVNGFAIDPTLPTQVFAGTDIGVYASNDGGATWLPWTTGMPVVPVFDMAIQNPNRIIRVATHGRGMWERQLDSPVATELSLVGAEIVNGHPQLTWYTADGAGETMNLYRRPVPGEFALVGPIVADGSGMLTYTDVEAVPGRSYEYEIGLMNGSTERRLGGAWVDVPVTASFGVKRIADTGSGPLQFAVTLTTNSPARLDLVDVTGRRIATQELAGMAPGEHRVQIDAATRPGVYWARLSQAGKMVSTRVALVR